MADKKISALTAATTPLAGTEVLPIVQSGSTVKVANNDLRPKQIQSNATSGVLQITGPAAATTRVMTTPDANFTAARTDAAQTFNGSQTFSTASDNQVNVNATGTGRYATINFQQGGITKANAFYDHVDGKLYLLTVSGVQIDQNLVQGTAAKGVNFTANTPAAGMTSQLLNWYEEGTWTPAITSSGGAITSTSNASGNYTRIGNQVTIWFTIKITNNGTGSGYIKLTGIPFNLASAGKTVATGVENGVSSKQLVIYGNTTTELIVTFYDSTYPGATNAVLVGCITYYV